jgi:hypothetical protein
MEVEPGTKALFVNMLELQNTNEEKFNAIKDQVTKLPKKPIAEEKVILTKTTVKTVISSNIPPQTVIEADGSDSVDDIKGLVKKVVLLATGEDTVLTDSATDDDVDDILEQESIKRANEEHIDNSNDDLDKKIAYMLTKLKEIDDISNGKLEKATEKQNPQGTTSRILQEKIDPKRPAKNDVVDGETEDHEPQKKPDTVINLVEIAREFNQDVSDDKDGTDGYDEEEKLKVENLTDGEK